MRCRPNSLERDTFALTRSLAAAIRDAEVPDRGVRIWRLTQAGFLFKSATRVVAVDPYLSDWLETESSDNPNPVERMRPAPLLPDDLGMADVVLCTHEHPDHLDPGTVAALASVSQMTLVVPEPLREDAVRLGWAPDRVVGVLVDEPKDLNGLGVTALPAAHAFHPEAFGGYTWWLDALGRHRAVGYVLELGGVRLFHAGDTVYWPGMGRLRELEVDVGLLPINGRDWRREAAGLVGNLNGREAADLAVAAGFALVIPCHYDGIVGNTADPADFTSYLQRSYPEQGFHILDGDEGLLVMPPRERDEPGRH